jgi:hypothetical protein
MFKWIGKTTDRIGAILGAFSFSQIPMYIQSYFLQLYGHLAELQYQIEQMRIAAMQNGKTLEQFIQKFVTSSDPDYKAEGELMNSMVERSDTFAQNLYALQKANLWEQPVIFFKTADWSIAQATLDTYEVGLPLNVDGGLFAFIGLVLGYIVVYTFRTSLWLLTYPFVKLFSRKPKESGAKH